MENAVKALAFYLPQYHPIAENDAWWGKGFTEWTNVTRAKPLFDGHRQPRLPADLGFYDLRVPEVRHQQIELARSGGVHGFCFYHYWFHGRRLIERPTQEYRDDKSANFPFSLLWANETWSRTWSGKGRDILLEQTYSKEDALALAKDLQTYFEDDRYIKINGKPLFGIYHPIPQKLWRVYVDTLRTETERHGFPGLYLTTAFKAQKQMNFEDVGFDAAFEFPPSSPIHLPNVKRRAHAQFGDWFSADFDGELMSHRVLMKRFMGLDYKDQKILRTVLVDFDNTARMGNRAKLLPDASPEIYARWLRLARKWTVENRDEAERIMFLFAWNEWAEGSYLEPDQDQGRDLLDVTKRILTSRVL